MQKGGGDRPSGQDGKIPSSDDSDFCPLTGSMDNGYTRTERHLYRDEGAECTGR